MHNLGASHSGYSENATTIPRMMNRLISVVMLPSNHAPYMSPPVHTTLSTSQDGTPPCLGGGADVEIQYLAPLSSAIALL
jgi:hypothetical protein